MVKPFQVIQKFIDQQNSLADFIQNGPSDGLPGYVRDQYRKRCDQFANLPPWARALGNGTAGTMDRICTPYWDDNGWDGPQGFLPFEGGQCVILYNFLFTSTRSNGQVQERFINGNPGPISGWSLINSGSSWFVRVNHASGFNQQAVESNTLPAPTISNVRVVRPDGQPDDCGNLPPDLQPGPNPPPNPGPTPGPEPTDDPFGGPIPDLPIPPYPDPIYGPTPIEPGDEPGDQPPQPAPPAGGDGLPGEPDAVGPSAGMATGGEDGEDVNFGPPPEGKVWVGALIELAVDPRFGNIPGTGPANTVYPTVLGNASLRYEGGRGRSSRLLSKWSDLVRPVTSLVVLGAYVHCLPGVVATVYPISAIICPENPCGEE